MLMIIVLLIMLVVALMSKYIILIMMIILMRMIIRGNPLSNATCLAQVFFKMANNMSSRGDPLHDETAHKTNEAVLDK